MKCNLRLHDAGLSEQLFIDQKKLNDKKSQLYRQAVVEDLKLGYQLKQMVGPFSNEEEEKKAIKEFEEMILSVSNRYLK